MSKHKPDSYRKKPVTVTAYQTDKPLEIETLEGVMRADAGDWIITGVKGEQYPCKPDIFAMTYEPCQNTTPTDAEIAGHLTALFNEGYGLGHNDTVEGCAVHIVSGDKTDYQRDVAEESEHYQSILHAYLAEKARRESAERVVDSLLDMGDESGYADALKHRAKYPRTDND